MFKIVWIVVIATCIFIYILFLEVRIYPLHKIISYVEYSWAFSWDRVALRCHESKSCSHLYVFSSYLLELNLIESS